MTPGSNRMTYGLAIATVAAWLLVYAANAQDYAVAIGAFIPARISGDISISGAIPAFLTPLSATLLHGGMFHLVMNMVMLVYCGLFVEAAIGQKYYIILYMAGAFASAGAQYALDVHSMTPMIGASGAISALIGCYAMFYGKNTAKSFGPISARIVNILWLAAAWIGVQALIGIASNQIAIAAHIGGFIAGLLLARPLLLWRYRTA